MGQERRSADNWTRICELWKARETFQPTVALKAGGGRYWAEHPVVAEAGVWGRSETAMIFEPVNTERHFKALIGEKSLSPRFAHDVRTGGIEGALNHFIGTGRRRYMRNVQ